MLQLNDYQLTRINEAYQTGSQAITGTLTPVGGGSSSDMSSEIPSRLQGYHGLDLLELSLAKLMHRSDTKYVMPLSYLPEVLERLQPYYSILEIDGHRMFTYQSSYFDTSDLRFFHMHHSGTRPRYKVRYRRYAETDTAYLEVKIKTNKNKTSKKRIKARHNPPNTGEIQQYSSRHLPMSMQDISPSLQVDFHRISLVNESSAERVTLDTSIQFRLPHGNAALRLSPVVVAELKKDRESKPGSPFSSLLRSLGVLPGKFSKYCVGCSLLYQDQVKSNRFKPVFLKLHKIFQKELTAL